MFNRTKGKSGVLCFWAHQIRAAADDPIYRTARQDPGRHGLRDDQATATDVLRGEMSMPKKPITIPKVRTEAEEAEWWDSHPEAATEIMKPGLKSGKARGAGPLES